MPTKTRTTILAFALALLLIPLAPVATARAATSPPTGLKVVGVSRTAAALSWNAVAGVGRYRVQYAQNSSMSGAKYVRFAKTSGEIDGLTPNTTYYVKVRAINSDGDNLSAYSPAIALATSKTYTHLSPGDLTATKTTPEEISLTWASRGTGIRYRVSWSKSSSFSSAKYVRTTAPKLTLTGLDPRQKYYLKVRVIDADGVNLSSYSPHISATTAASEAMPEASTTFDAPSGLRVTAAARTAVALAWTKVSGAQAYRIQYSSSSSMSGATYVRVSDGTVAEIPGLSSGQDYYFKVRVISPDGDNLSPYSAAITAATASSASSSYLPVTGLTAAAKGSNQLSVDWAGRGQDLTYEVVYADNSSLDGASSIVTTATSATLTGLSAATTYHLKVRVIALSGDGRSARSAYSTVISAKTTASVPSTLRVGSYNIKCANCYAGAANEGTWYERRDSVVKTVLAQNLDVVGFQEAGQAWLKDSSGKSVNQSQFEDLVKRLGSPYKLTNPARNNCVKSTTPSKCVYKDQGASQGTKIVYDSSALTLIDEGSTRLSELKASDNDRYVAWAILEQKSSGKRFFFADTHLEHAVDAAGTYYALRIKQTQEVAAVVKKQNQGLPTFIVGDFNSSKWTSPSNGPYDVLTAAGYFDPLGNTQRSTTSAPEAIVEKRIRTNFSSFNGFRLLAPATSNLNGTYIDYIWTSKGIGVPEWETSVNVDSHGYFVGTIPSDHNLLRATTTLP